MESSTSLALLFVLGGSIAALGACAAPSEDSEDSDPTSSLGEALSLTATYDATLKAPKCSSAASSCDSGSLARGRGPLGPESHAPNTLYGSCADGTAGTYKSDESVESVRVATTDGSNLAPGKTVNVTATVWAWSGYTSDKLDLYFTANASVPSPTWTLIKTLTPAGAGQQTLTASYTLPSGGSVQAVRASFRYGGSAGPCVAASYTDRDDLAFVVGASTPPAPDTTPPTTSVTAPTAGASVSGIVPVTAAASDNVGVTKVEFYEDAALLGVSTQPPWTVNWNTSTENVGAHVLRTKAYDAAGNVGTSTTVTVNVSGPLPVVVQNAGFEQGTAGWTLTSGYNVKLNSSYALAPHGGNTFVYLMPETMVSPPSLVAPAALSQVIALPTGTSTIEVWHKETGTYSASTFTPLRLRVTGHAATDPSLVATGCQAGFSFSGWSLLSCNVSAFAGTTVTLFLERTVDSGFTVAIDDVAVR